MKSKGELSVFKAYSPLHFIVGSLANITANKYYEIAKKKCPIRLVPNAEFITNNVVASSELVNSNDINNFRQKVTELYNANAGTEKLISAIKGRYVIGDRGEAEGLYLSEAILPYDDLLKIIYSTSLFRTLQSTYGCEFICRTAAIFKTKESNNMVNGSTRFHRDGHPFWNFKVLLYVTDVDSLENGPTSYIPGSAKPVVPGFGSYRTERPTDVSLYEENAVLGKSGTALLFNTNGMHAGGRTTNGERIIATLQFIPKYRSDLDKYAFCKSYRFGELEFDII